MILPLQIAGVRLDLALESADLAALARLVPFAGASGPPVWRVELAPGPAPTVLSMGRWVVERGGRWVIPGAEDCGWLDPAAFAGSARADPGLLVLDTLLRAAVASTALKKGGLLLHGVAVLVDGRAYVCPARSGSGKSTLASLARHPLSDEVSALLPIPGGGFAAHATPWWTSRGGSAPLSAVCALSWEGEGLSPEPGTALRQLVANLVLPLDSAPNRARALEVAAAVARGVPYARLAFRPDSDVDELLRHPLRPLRRVGPGPSP